MTKVSVIIPTYNRLEYLRRLIDSIKLNTYKNVEVIVIDNNSTDGTTSKIAIEYDDVIVLKQDKNTYSSGGRNIGASIATGQYLFFVDDDNVLDSQCIENLVIAFKDNPNAGLIGPLALYKSSPDIIWCAEGVFNKLGMPFHKFENLSLKSITLPKYLTDALYFPNAYMMTSESFNLTKHDTNRFPHNWSEQDICKRLQQKKYVIVGATKAITYHDIEVNRRITRIGLEKTFDQARSRILFRKLYQNNLWSWLIFILLIFPISTLYYTKAFFHTNDEKPLPLLITYFKGTVHGIRQD